MSERTRSIDLKTADEREDDAADKKATANAKRRQNRRREQATATWWIEVYLSSRHVSHIVSLRELTATEKLLLIVVAGTTPTPKQIELAASLGIQPRQVRSLLSRLASLGYIQRSSHRNRPTWIATEHARRRQAPSRFRPRPR